MNLEWLKKHKAAAIAGGVVALLVLYVLFRNSSSSSNSLNSAIAQQNQGQEQMAELNAQESAQEEQTQAELAGQEYQTQASVQEEQDQTAGALASQIIPDQLEESLYGEEIGAQEQEQENLLPDINEALQISTQGNRAVTGVNELGLLLGEGSVGSFNAEAGVNASQPQPLNIVLSGLGSTANTVAGGLFG